MRRSIAFLAVLALAVVAFGACDPDVSPVVPVDPNGPPPDPIVLVHGWNSSPGAWDTFVARLGADDFPANRIFNFDYDDGQSNVKTAGELAAFIDATLAATHAAKVDVVTHSMGSLPLRYLLKNNPSYWPKVDGIAAIAGVNHGTNLAWLWFSDAVNEMKPGSDFLDALNAGDETPGPARWATWWSPCDEVINPDDSALLVGAANHETACKEHSALHDDVEVYRQIRLFLN